MADWFARPVLHVSDVEASIGFYVDRLGFAVPWRLEEDGATRVAQVKSPLARQRAECNTRPPSSGNAGRRLKTARIRLM